MSMKKSHGGRGRETRVSSGRVARKPRLDSSRAPKKPYRPGYATTLRKQGGSVFASVARTKSKSKNDDGSDVDFNTIADRGFRLQQVLAAAGYGSRRQCETLVSEGRVEVDGVVVTEQGVRVKPGEQKIRVDGEGLPKVKPVYIALNKPKNALCTNSDPQGRRRVLDFMPEDLGRLFPVGRLDQNSEGLILLTNDGALAQRLTHPSYEVPKRYRVQVAGLVDHELVNALKRGVHIAEGVVQADEVTIRASHKKSSVLEITLTEGKNREIRRMLARVGHKVMQLQRVQVGTIKLGKLAPGDFRRLTAAEVADLYRLAENPRKAEPENKSRNLAPVELSTLEERESEKALLREDAKALEREKAKRQPNDPNYSVEVRKQFKRKYESVAEFEAAEGEPRLERRSGRRASKDEFRDEFRSEERGESRRRARHEFDDEVRTIGPKKFSRDEDDSRVPDRFNADASKLRREERRRRGSRAGDDGAREERSTRSSKRDGGSKSRKGPRQPRQGRATRGGRGR